MYLLDILFPPRCYGCRAVGRYLCRACVKTLSLRTQQCPECDRSAIDGETHIRCQRPFGLDGLISVFRYTGPIKAAIKSLKYRFVSDTAKTLIDTIPFSAYPALMQFAQTAVLYPIPLHRERHQWRGFNQAEELATYIAKRLQVRVMIGLLKRNPKRKPQADIAYREERIRNAKGLFARVATALPKQIILIDDVWTTGATMKEATLVLKRGGTEAIWGFSLAR